VEFRAAGDWRKYFSDENEPSIVRMRRRTQNSDARAAMVAEPFEQARTCEGIMAIPLLTLITAILFFGCLWHDRSAADRSQDGSSDRPGKDANRID